VRIMSDERKVQEVLARYVRTTDRRDGKSQSALYTDDAIVEIFIKTGHDAYQPIGEPIIGGSGVEYAVDNFMAPHPAGGWPEATFGIQGTVRPIESGYYDTDLRRIGGEWKITRHRVLHDMPYVIPEA
jgi:hypothetical protein